MAFTVRPIDGARKGDYDDLHGEVKPQRIVNWNIKIDPGLYDRRRAISEDQKLPDHRRYGAVITTGRGMNGDVLNLNENEVLVGSRTGGDPGSWSHLREPDAFGFQALNAMHIPEGYTAEDMADRHPIIGLSRGAYFVSPNVPEQTQSGVAGAVSGSVPLLNNSPKLKPWRPRDMLLARWPSTDPTERMREESTKPKTSGVDKQRLTVYLEPATYLETRLYFEKALTQSFEEEYAPRFSAANYFVRGTIPGGLAPAERAVATTRGTLQMAAYSLVAMILTHVNDNDASLAAAVRDPRALAAAIGSTLLTDKGPTIVGGARDTLDRRLIDWAGALGISAPHGAAMQQETFLCDHIVGFPLRPFLINRGQSNYFDIANFFSMASRLSARSASATGIGTQPIPTHPVGAIVWAQGTFGPGMLAGIKGSVERLMNRYVAHALDYTAPGARGAVYR